ncbi:prepilin-type N-terminal cleavage/methylation domain-containing protein [Dyella koreensis]|uniref:Prepilin-type N-terminal cleavage/methylation domain-containing protein n=1 Tax=Dyella koreensis TaxID=311235 RepID=A0ABW8K808_9GAMM
MSDYVRRYAKPFRHSSGFTLIELMVAMLLGLIVVGGVASVFLAGQQTYRANDALSDVENGSRAAFEMLAHDIRNAGLTGCDNSNGRVANVINPPFPWYADWANALHGYDDATKDPALVPPAVPTTGEMSPVANTSSVHVISTGNLDVTVSSVPSSNAANIKINADTSQLNTGDMIMLCDFDHAAIVQIDVYAGSGMVVVHNTGNKVSPGNCSKGLGYPTICSGSATGNGYSFPPNSRIAKLTASVWYIGNNSANGRSLYRLNATSSSSGISAVPQEMVRNVTGMTIKYMQPSGADFVTAASVTNWATANAAQIKLTLQSTNPRATVNGAAPLVRPFTSTTTVRNRVQ